jgi:hypothetical protein
MSRRSAIGLIEEVIEASPKALHRAVSKLPKDFPGEIAAAIVRGVKGRVEQLASEPDVA